MTGMELLLLHPQIASRDCGDCQQFLYDEKTGKPVTRGRGENARKQPRHTACPPPCRTSAGCLKGTPEEPRGLSDRNTLAVNHYRECRAVGAFPDDPIVRSNAVLIRAVEDFVDRHERLQAITLFAMRRA